MKKLRRIEIRNIKAEIAMCKVAADSLSVLMYTYKAQPISSTTIGLVSNISSTINLIEARIIKLEGMLK